MNKTELQQYIIQNIQEIYSFVNRFENQNQVHQIDIDLALSKVRNLYDLLLKLNAKGVYYPEYQKEEKLTIHKPSEKQVEERVEDSIKEEPKKATIVDGVENKPDPVILLEEVEEQKEISQPIVTKKSVPVKEDRIKKEPVKKKKQDAPGEILADKFHSKAYMHDTIGKEKTDKKDVSSKLKSKPIKDINSAIGINDKFVFIRELFNGDKTQYAETIQILNNFDTFENALVFLKENFTWDLEDVNVGRLVELVRRKYTN